MASHVAAQRLGVDIMIGPGGQLQHGAHDSADRELETHGANQANFVCIGAEATAMHPDGGMHNKDAITALTSALRILC